MTLRSTLVTLVTVGLFSLSACGTSPEEAEPTPEPSATATQPEQTFDIVGTWYSEDEDWTVHFLEDGTFTEDFQGHEDFRSGQWRLDDGVVELEGDDGNTTEGQVSDDTLEFNLGTLSRVQG